jgi:hypothetical protein
MTATCYVCRSPELAADADPRSPTCETCKPARQHIVSMQTGEGGSAVAACPCGWRVELTGEYRRTLRDAAVRQHWREIIDSTGAVVPA